MSSGLVWDRDSLKGGSRLDTGMELDEGKVQNDVRELPGTYQLISCTVGEVHAYLLCGKMAQQRGVANTRLQREGRIV